MKRMRLHIYVTILLALTLNIWRGNRQVSIERENTAWKLKCVKSIKVSQIVYFLNEEKLGSEEKDKQKKKYIYKF